MSQDTEKTANTYTVRECRGHWHVTIGDDDIGDPFATQAEAQAEANRLNSEASADRLLELMMDAPIPETP